MTRNRGKQFETVIKTWFEDVADTYVLRIPDQMSRYKGSTNISDFIVYHYPHQYFIECKTVQGNRFPISNISFKQRTGMLDAVRTRGVRAGVIVWYIKFGVTRYFSIQVIQQLKEQGIKSIPWNTKLGYAVVGTKKRVFFEYDMERFFKEVNDE